MVFAVSSPMITAPSLAITAWHQCTRSACSRLSMQGPAGWQAQEAKAVQKVQAWVPLGRPVVGGPAHRVTIQYSSR